MRKTISVICVFVFILFILLFPEVTVHAAADGLLLWYTSLLPTLLPLGILSNILIASGYFHYITKYLYAVIKPFYPISRAGVFPLFAGLLFGFPLGSKITADLVSSHEMSKAEGNILICICNNLSPVFLNGYVFCTCLKRPDLLPVGIVSLYLPPLFYGFFGLLRCKKENVPASDTKKPTSRSQLNFKIIDAGILNGFETLTKLGGYIMFFSILTAFIRMFPFGSELTQTLCAGILEVTTGIHKTSAIRPFPLRFALALGFTSFGGICGLAQTSSMIKDAGLSTMHYLKMKMGFAISSVCIGMLFLSGM